MGKNSTGMGDLPGSPCDEPILIAFLLIAFVVTVVYACMHVPTNLEATGVTLYGVFNLLRVCHACRYIEIYICV